MARNPKHTRRARKAWKRLMHEIRMEGRAKCPHTTVLPSKTYEDGSIDGKCVRCGEDGFPIRDVAWEEFRRAEGGDCGFGEVWS